MVLLPASTNADYRGAAISAWFLALVGVLTVAPGAIHYFLPDGGAGIIAGIDLSQNGATIVSVFAWMGAMQIPHGLAEIAVALRYRTLVPLFLALALLERSLMALDAWVLKGADAVHRPPEHYGSLAFLPLIALFLALSLREDGRAAPRG
jgi:hypothetical protein